MLVAGSQPSMAEGAEEGQKLAELLAVGWQLWEELETDTAPSSGSPAVQEKVRQGLDVLRRVNAMVAQLELFSENEDLEEIASSDLKYLLLPALLGAMTLKQVDMSKRLEHLESARTLFWSFLKRCKSYGLGSFHLPPATSPTAEDGVGSPARRGPAAGQDELVAMATSRQAKIERYKQKKELENRLASLKNAVDSGQADEEQIRAFYILQTQKWINTSLEEIESVDQEIAILRSRGTAKQSSAPPHGTSRQVRPPMKPFILTRDAVQNKVFGAGYPSLPVMTVDDWYDQRRRQGVLSGQSTPAAGLTDEELQKQEQKEEEDDEEALQKARNMDDWKDTHPRGYGNRHNMG
ncbi:immunoglobulin-binding protein 1 isoform X1 [Melopsittacus undulatus]|uniref:immunoglobulin-binding protein 1 isoform X1 n=1 Tax=Melopsittacus undulatus TaxID=13146 RepID=UPI00146B92C1|nr:immunoglobulin-binding protein 1 isoform X1 [Melopsittacus undulatus]